MNLKSGRYCVMQLMYLFLFRSGICFIVLFLGSNVTAQKGKIEKVSIYRYQYEQSVYKYEELEPFFKESNQVYALYNKYKSQKKASKIFGYSSLALIGSGTIIGLSGSENNCSSGGICAHEVYGVLIGVAGIIPGTIALIMSFKSNRSKKKSIDLFNQLKVEKTSYILKIGPTRDGIGLVINF